MLTLTPLPPTPRRRVKKRSKLEHLPLNRGSFAEANRWLTEADGAPARRQMGFSRMGATLGTAPVRPGQTRQPWRSP